MASLERRARSGGVRADFSGESSGLVEVAAACCRRGEGCPERERRISWSMVADLMLVLMEMVMREKTGESKRGAAEEVSLPDTEIRRPATVIAV